MTAHPEAAESKRWQQGATLIELVLSMVIISVALVGIFSVMNYSVAHSADPIIEQQAVAIAEAYLEEIILQSYSVSPGTGTRANFDDVDDYNGLTDVGVHDQLGNPVSGLGNYNVSVSVAAPVSISNVNAKQITVSVSRAEIATLTLTSYKMEH